MRDNKRRRSRQFAGPGEPSLRGYLNTVKFACGDFGDESAIADCPDVLPMFITRLRRMGEQGNSVADKTAASRVKKDSYLFPRLRVKKTSHWWPPIAIP